MPKQQTLVVSSFKMNGQALTFAVTYEGLLSEEGAQGILHDFKIDAEYLAKDEDVELEFIEEKIEVYADTRQFQWGGLTVAAGARTTTYHDKAAVPQPEQREP
jgi:hypothetical protein